MCLCVTGTCVRLLRYVFVCYRDVRASDIGIYTCIATASGFPDIKRDVHLLKKGLYNLNHGCQNAADHRNLRIQLDLDQDFQIKKS